MNIGVAGPMTLSMLDLDQHKSELPIGYNFPLISVIMNAYLKRGHHVVGFTTSTGISSMKVYKKNNLTVCVVPRRENWAARDFFLEERMYMVNAMQQYKTDVIHAHWTYEFGWSAISSGIPALITMHDHAWTILKQSRDAYRFMRWLMNTYVFYKAEYLSCVSDYLFGFLSKKNRHKTRVIPLFYPSSLNTIEPIIEKNKNVVSVCNGFSRRKNIEGGLHAFARIHKQYPEWRYDLIGTDMEFGGQAYKYAQINGLSEGVNFIGPLPFEETIQRIRHSGIFLHPSREEAGATAVTEAMFLGTPVVGGLNSGYVPTLLSDGRGFLCDVESPASISSSIEQVIQSTNLRAVIDSAHEYAKNNHSEEVIMNLYELYLKEILKKK